MYMHYNKLNPMLSISKQFETLINFKIKLDLFYSDTTIEIANSNLEDLISEFSSSVIKEIVVFTHTINKKRTDFYMNNETIKNRIIPFNN